MTDSHGLTVIARIHTRYPAKFGVPRQPGLADALTAEIRFEPPFRNADAVRGLEGFEYIWLIWGFDLNERETWSPTVRPPILGGTQRVGVFATRSSFRPNSLGLSSVKLLAIDPHGKYAEGESGPVLTVAGADMVDGTPIYDIKPYIASWDAHPQASEGWREGVAWPELKVEIPSSELGKIPTELHEGLLQLLRQDPRPAYTRTGQEDRVFWVPLGPYAIRFTVTGSHLSVIGIDTLTPAQQQELQKTGSIRDYDK
ncbi:MAG: tRNA (N6-threonylcarbamoyladenosine(37)-N6)-methyltransferase TrmO [Coriobacteriales bacterium]|nr:tRNA (N6-threonylcarbamoyladenosine(37)-N6)-methyltransferase TrmO [Coriobacteriales bacterium]